MYLNFFPGSTQENRSLSIDEQAGYAIEDLEGFVRSVIDGCTCSLWIAEEGEQDELKDHINALEDGALLAEWFGVQDSEDETEGQRAQREAVEEVHAVIFEYAKAQ